MNGSLLRASLVGLSEALLISLALAAGLWWLDPRLALGVPWGVAAVGAGRLVGLLFTVSLPRERRAGLAAGLMGPARILLVGALSVAGIPLGLSPLGVALGLSLPPLALWGKVVILRRFSC